MIELPQTDSKAAAPVVALRRPPTASRGRFRVAAIVLAVVGAAVALRLIPQHSARAPHGGGALQTAPVPVVPAVVTARDVSIYLDGIGTVQAFNTVTVNTRVDGEVKKVAFTEGQDVKAGDLLVQIDEAPYRAALDQAIAKQGQDEAQLANARLNLMRDADLYAKKAISTQDRDTQQALVNQLDAAVKADAAAIAGARVQLDYTKIVAPIAGRTGLRLVDQGNILHAADRTGIVVLTQLQPISLVFTLPEQDLAAIHQAGGSPADFSVLAVDRDTSTELDRGTLSVIDNQIDAATGTIRLKASFANDRLQLWPGQFANARLLLSVRKGGLVVPASVVQRGPQGPFAFVIKGDDTVEIRPIKVGPIEQGEALIESGLQAGERVVADGQYKLQAGSRVKLDGAAAKPGA
jgi:multidrug efflux system membrane fusion protein